MACQTEKISETQLKLARYALKIGDLPKGWKFTGKSWGNGYGDEGYTVTYEIDDHNFLSHTISIYSNQSQAQKGYEEWNNEWFESTQPWPEAKYFPLDSKDDYKFECLRLNPESPLLSCRYLQRHNEIISFVRTSLDNTSMTFAELDKVLGVLDERVNTVTLMEETPTP
jgi:hypothetical protein